MLSAFQISELMWQCAYIYGCQDEFPLTERDLRVLRAMRYYFRADERPPQSLATRAMGIVTLYKARQTALPRRLKVLMARQTRRAVDLSREGNTN